MIEQLKSHLKSELEQVEAEILQAIRSGNSLIREVGNYIFATPGKRLRPIITMLSSQLFPARPKAITKMAAAMELVHTATLLHDDVIDKAELRRGRPTVNAKWGQEVAILMADYLYSYVFNEVVKEFPPLALSLLTRTTSKMCEGEMFQIQKRNQYLSEPDYLKIIRRKTAYLFSACGALGSLTTNAQPSQIGLLANYGLNFGMAFQITDDTLDFLPPDEKWGKAIANDINEGKQTLPFIYTLQAASDEDRQLMAQFFSDGRNLQSIVGIIKKYQGFDYSLNRASHYAEEAEKNLNSFPASTPKQLLTDLSRYIVTRTF